MRFFASLVALPLALAAPLLAPRQDADVIPGSFVVVMRDGTSESVLQSTVQRVTELLGGTAPEFVYNMDTFKGFSASFTDALLTTVTGFGEVAYVEPNTVVRTSALTRQADAPYGLARISHREPGSSEYIYDRSAGAGTHSYIIDTGIYTEHNDFEGRATFLADFAGDGMSDGNGHGTHVAGTTGGKKYGVAKKTRLYAVKVLSAGGSGSTAGVIKGVEFSVNHAKQNGRIGKAVANMSLGGVRSQAMNQAVAAAVREGMFMAVAAGNSASPTFTASPASEPSVCTVGASDMQDLRAFFSNYGLLVDIYAPGVDIISAWIGGPDDTNTISGTSMASPHVAGLGAYLLALEGSMGAEALCDRIVELSTKGALTPVLLNNNLAYNGNGA